MPFVESTELALILGRPHVTVHRHLTGLLAEDIVAKVSHGTVHLSSSQRCHLTTSGRQSYFGRYPHRKPNVSARLSQRSRFALPMAAASASFRHRRWSSLRDASRGSVCGGRVRP